MPSTYHNVLEQEGAERGLAKEYSPESAGLHAGESVDDDPEAADTGFAEDQPEKERPQPRQRPLGGTS